MEQALPVSGIPQGQKASDILTREEIREFTTLNNWLGAWAILRCWAIIILCFSLVALVPSVWTWGLAILLIAGQQHVLAVLLHEAGHYSLFTSRRIADFVGRYFCGDPIGLPLKYYRRIHGKHHSYTGTAQDPDLILRNAYPTSWASFLRKITRDLVGISGVKMVIGFLLMGFGFLEYNFNGEVLKRAQTGRTLKDILVEGWQHLHGTFLFHLALLGVLIAIGQPQLYALWWVAYLMPYSLFLRIRSIADHAGTPGGANRFLNTRTTYPNWFTRLIIAPINVTYHIEHHLLSTVPYYKLPQLHRLLQQKGVLREACVAQGFSEVLRQNIIAA